MLIHVQKVVLINLGVTVGPLGSIQIKLEDYVFIENTFVNKL